MSTTVSWAGSSHNIPVSGERAWGAAVTAFLVSVAANALSKRGGSFSLTSADVDWGTTYGHRAVKFASRNTPATSGIFRLGNAESVSWRDAANSADLALKVNASDVLEFDGNPLLTLALGAASTVLRMNAGGTAYEWSLLTDADVDPSAAISWSKVSKSGSNLTDLATRNHSDLSGVGTNTHAQIDTALSAAASHIANSSNPHSVTKSQIGLGNVDNTSNATERAATATLTNKTFDDPLTVKQVSTPSNPSSGYNKIYTKADGLLYKLDSAGNEVLVGSGAGSGEINIVINADGDTALDGNRTNDVGDWVDAGTGTTSTRTTTTSEVPLYPTKTNAIKIANDGSSTGYTYMRMTLPPSLYSRKLKIAWEQLVSTSTAYASGDFKVELYSNASSNYGGAYTAIALSTDVSSVSSIPAQNGRFQTTFDASTAQYLELRITRVAGSASSFIVLNNVTVGPGIQPQGAVVGEWQSFTPSWSASSPSMSSNSGRYRRVGDSMEIEAGFIASGTGTASAVTLTVPFSLNVDTTKISFTSGNNAGVQGTATFVDASASVKALNAAVAGGSSASVAFVKAGEAVDSIDGDEFASGDQFGLHVTLPIAEWTGSGTVNLAQNDVTYVAVNSTWNASDTTLTSLVYGPAGAQMSGGLSALATKRVRGPSGTIPIVQIQNGNSTGLGWVNASDLYPHWNDGTNTAGIRIYPVSGTTTDYDVEFSQYRYRTSSAWQSTFSWRVAFVAPGQAVGFGAASQTSLGLVKAGQVPGTNTNDDAVAGYVGELKESNSVDVSVGTDGVYVPLASVLLTAGDWDVEGTAVFTQGTLGSLQTLTTAISKNSTSLDNAATGGVALLQTSSAPSAYMPTGQRRITVANGATQAVYIVGRANYSGSAGTGAWSSSSRIRARRVR